HRVAAQPNSSRSSEAGSGTAAAWASPGGRVSPVRKKPDGGLFGPLSGSDGRSKGSGLSVSSISSGGGLVSDSWVFVSPVLEPGGLVPCRLPPPVVSPPLGRSTTRLSMAKDFFLPRNSRV